MHAIIWEYIVRPEHILRFEEVYGPNGTWAQFFARSAAYRGTSLLTNVNGAYTTIDYWSDASGFVAFLSRARDEYQAIDQSCRELTVTERCIGRFNSVD